MGSDLKICLSIETTGRHVGVSLLEYSSGGTARVLASSYEEKPAQQAEGVIPTIDRLLRRVKRKKEQLSLLAVDIGPGSFTGVRVGLAVARTMAQGLELPLVGVCGLEAMAFAVSVSKPGVLVVPHILAVEGEVYFAAYQSMKEIKKPCWTPDSVLATFRAQHRKGVETSTPARPEDVGHLAIQRFLKKPKSPEFHYENIWPLYLQPTWAERTLQAKKL